MELKITDVRQNPGDSAFLIDDGKTAILYDTGFGFTGFDIADKIKNELGNRTLDYIFLTHSHYDHALGSAYILQKYPKAQVVASEYAAYIFSKPSAKEVMKKLDREFAKKCGVTEYEDLADSLRVDIAVKDGDCIQAGDMRFLAIALPGHTKCSMGFYLESEKLLLNAETVGIYDGESTVLPSYLVGYQMTLESIDKVRALEISQIVLPHYGLLAKDKTEFYLSECKKSAVSTFEDISAMLDEGKSKAEAVKYFKDRFYRGNVRVIYPPDAIDLNTNIMVDLIEREKKE